jgi:hypothetical protein
MLNVLLCLLCNQSGSSVYTSFVEALRAASTVSGQVEITVVTPHSTTRYTDVFRFQRPNLSRLETWRDKRLVQLSVWRWKDLLAVQRRTELPANGLELFRFHVLGIPA